MDDTRAIPPPSASTLPSGPELLRQSLALCKDRWRALATIVAVAFTASAADVLASGAGPAALGVSVIAVVVSVASYLALVRVVTSGERSAKTAYAAGAPLLFPYMWLCVLAFFAILGGLLLFIVPGVIVAILMSCGVYALFVEDRHGLSALVQSWQYVRRRAGQVIARELFLLLVLSPAIVLVIALEALAGDGYSPRYIAVTLTSTAFAQLIWTATLVYGFAIFRALKERFAGPPSEAETGRIRRNVRALVALGVVGPLTLAALAVSLL